MVELFDENKEKNSSGRKTAFYVYKKEEEACKQLKINACSLIRMSGVYPIAKGYFCESNRISMKSVAPSSPVY